MKEANVKSLAEPRSPHSLMCCYRCLLFSPASKEHYSSALHCFADQGIHVFSEIIMG